MNKVHAAYQKLGVAPGTSFDVAKRRYRQLVIVWHPDRMPTPEGRRTAEEELKQINNAFDSLRKHFESEHRQGPGCDCQPSAVNSQQTGSGQNQNGGNSHSNGDGHAGGGQGYSNPGGSQREKTAYEKWREQEAEAERRRRAEEAHEAALKEALEKARRAAAEQAAAAAKSPAKTSNPPMTEDQMRWKLAAAFAVIFVFLLIGGFNRRHEPSAITNSDSATAEHLMPCPFVN